MQRKNFLRTLGLAGVSLTIPTTKVFSDNNSNTEQQNCVLIPTETAGPYPLDLTENLFYFRQDIRETQTGVQLNLKIKVLGTVDCAPMPNVRVNVWHCSVSGLYSGYDNASNPGQTGLTYLRGYQIADANGDVEFITILPGWYVGRTCHIHFQVYVSTAYAAISQLTFPVDTKNEIYLANPGLYPEGTDPVTPSSDGVFADGYAYQMTTLTPNIVTGGYDAYLEVTVEGSGTSGVGHLERVNAQQFILGQNFPNPFNNITTVPFTLIHDAAVKLELWDINGKKLMSLDQGNLSAGMHTVNIDLNKLHLPLANYVYQIEIMNSSGTYREYKLMTAKN